MNSTEVKPGILTTEFWGAISSTVLLVLVVAGVVGETEADTIGELVGGLVAAVLPIGAYIWSRTKVKTQ